MTIQSQNADLVWNCALAKFGKPQALKPTDSTHREFALFIERDHPAINDRPYMGIRGAINEHGTVHFYWGHYDLTKDQAVEYFKSVGVA